MNHLHDRSRAPRTLVFSGLLAACAAVSSAALGGGCSLLRLDTYRLAQCTQQAQCEPLNAAKGLGTDRCVRYVCRANPAQGNERTCVLGPRDLDGDGDPDVQCGGTDCDDTHPERSRHQLSASGDMVDRPEVCDGVDNNCDGVIDEQAGLFNVAADGTATPTVAGLTATARLAGGAASTAGSAGYLYTSGADAPTLAEPGAMPRVTPLVMRTQTTGSMPASNPSANLSANEPAKCFDGNGVGNTINALACGAVLDSATAELEASSGRWLLASVHVGSCPHGNLRLGLFAAGGSGAVDELGPPLFSPVAGGVGAWSYPLFTQPATAGMVAGGPCTGNSSGRNTPATEGAARPTIAPLGSVAVPATGTSPNRPQALAAWLGRAAVADACSAAESPVEALVVWPEEQNYLGAGTLRWVNASDRGHPATLGTTRSDAPVTVLPWAQPAGYLVLFPAASGNEIVVSFVGALDTTQAQTLDEFAPATTRPTLDGRTYETRATPALTVRSLRSFPVVAGMGPVVSVSAATRGSLGAPQGSGTVGLVWQQGCGLSATRHVYFQRLDVDPGAAGTVSALDAQPTELGSQSAGGPSRPSARFATGFLVPGTARGAMTVDGATSGGWVLSWLEQAPAQAVVQRFSELDGQPVDAQSVRIPSPQGVVVSGFAMVGAASDTQARVAVQTESATYELGALCRASTP